MRSFWKWLAIFAYRRWARGEPRKPVGVPFNRDPENPCEHYEPRKRQLSDWADCHTDGHYLCNECCRRSVEEPPGALTGIRVYEFRKATP